MSSLAVGLISAGTIFTGSLLGIGLQRFLPGHHFNKETQDVVKLSAGTIATLTAMVLGLLVSSAKGSFDATNTAVVLGSTKIIILDRALAAYGPETQPTREQLRRSLAASIENVWPLQKTGVSTLTVREEHDDALILQQAPSAGSRPGRADPEDKPKSSGVRPGWPVKAANVSHCETSRPQSGVTMPQIAFSSPQKLTGFVVVRLWPGACHLALRALSNEL